MRINSNLLIRAKPLQTTTIHPYLLTDVCQMFWIKQMLIYKQPINKNNSSSFRDSLKIDQFISLIFLCKWMCYSSHNLTTQYYYLNSQIVRYIVNQKPETYLEIVYVKEYMNAYTHTCISLPFLKHNIWIKPH